MFLCGEKVYRLFSPQRNWINSLVNLALSFNLKSRLNKTFALSYFSSGNSVVKKFTHLIE